MKRRPMVVKISTNTAAPATNSSTQTIVGTNRKLETKNSTIIGGDCTEAPVETK